TPVNFPAMGFGQMRGLFSDNPGVILTNPPLSQCRKSLRKDGTQGSCGMGQGGPDKWRLAPSQPDFGIHPTLLFRFRDPILSFGSLALFDQRVRGLRLDRSKLTFSLLH